MTRFLLSALLFCLVAPVPSRAQDGERVHIGFQNPFRIPGAILPAGEYFFVPGQPVAGQLIIEIFKADPPALVASVLAIESGLPRPADATLLDYSGTEPPALRAWFHPGFPHGYEFVYGREEATAIYAASNTPVAAAAADAVDAGVLGMVPIAHADDLYRAGVPVEISRELGIAAVPPGPIDRLTLARVAILSHLEGLPGEVAARLRLLDAQLRDLYTSYRTGQSDFPWRLSLAQATLGNMPPSFYEEPGLAHVIERVRAQLDAFVAYFR